MNIYMEFRNLGGKSFQKRAYDMPERIWKHDNTIYHKKKTQLVDMDLDQLAQNRIQWQDVALAVFKFRVLIPKS